MKVIIDPTAAMVQKRDPVDFDVHGIEIVIGTQVIEITEERGQLHISTRDGGLRVVPQAANVILVKQVGWNEV